MKKISLSLFYIKNKIKEDLSILDWKIEIADIIYFNKRGTTHPK